MIQEGEAMDFPQFKEEFHLPGIKLLPHRDPFLFVDELISADETGAFGKYTYTDANGETVDNGYFDDKIGKWIPFGYFDEDGTYHKL